MPLHRRKKPDKNIVVDYTSYLDTLGDHIICGDCGGNYLVPTTLGFCPYCLGHSLQWACEVDEFLDRGLDKETDAFELRQKGLVVERNPDGGYCESLHKRARFQNEPD